MYINVDILCDILSGKFQIKHYGHGIGNQALSLPVFYERGVQPDNDKVYIARTYDLPASPNKECLFICIGNTPANIWSSWRGEVLHITDSGVDIMAVFNAVQEIFNRIMDWECGMQLLLEGNADIEELLRISIPIFENRITIIDYNLSVVAYCEASEFDGRKEVRLSKSYERVPEDKSMLFENLYQQYIKRKEPFVYQERGIDQYCINLYIGEKYMGTCSLMKDFRPIRDSDYLLFQRFTAFIRRALSIQSRAVASQFVSLKAIFSELLNSFPVSRNDLNRALTTFRRNSQNANLRSWLCFVIRSANKRKTLPEDYLCTVIEEMLPDCTAIAYEGIIAVFCAFDPERTNIVNFCDILEPYLRDMNFVAGMSQAFDDIYKARDFFFQAECALETGFEREQTNLVFKFEDYALTYMLQHACGQFEPELVFPSGLLKLKGYGGGATLWDTLRRYLDNESNASRTAQDLFLHRSSLLPRLEKIKTYVKMETPEERLYLRMCVYLMDLLDKG